MSSRRPDQSEYHPRYGRYIDLVPEIDLPAAFAQQLDSTRQLFARIGESAANIRYAPEKWTVREVLGHILDTERIFGYRLLCFARGDSAKLQRADEQSYVLNADFGRYSMAELLEEFTLVRRSHESLIRHLPEAAWDRTGEVNGNRISVRAIAYLMLGHERHHDEIVLSRYLQAAPQIAF
jgi:uncharacterized damage-inducible protein DinB